MKGRSVAAFVLSLSLAQACGVQDQKPNLNKPPIAETIRNAAVKMADDGKDKLNGLVPAKAEPEKKTAEHADGGIVRETAPAETNAGKKENPFGIDWSKVKLAPPSKSRGRDPEEIERAEKTKSTR